MSVQETIHISVDAMGGDHGPEVVLAGMELSLQQIPNIHFIVFGDESILIPLVISKPHLADRCTIHHAPLSIPMDAKPTQALRVGRGHSSMWRALEAVKRQEADLCVSGGNTGALMAMAKFCLRTLAQIDRPAIAALWPTLHGESVVLDLGASIGADAQYLVDLAIMGSAMARVVLDIERPSVGLLNIGVEEVKGLEEIKAAHRILKASDWKNFCYNGFVEGDDLGKGVVDVVVTEGFSGNIALKTAEGTAKQLAQYMQEAMRHNLMSKIGYLFARSAFKALKQKMDPRLRNGGVFLGLEGLVVKSHGSTDSVGYSHAIKMGYEMARRKLLTKIKDTLLIFRENQPSLPLLEEGES